MKNPIFILSLSFRLRYILFSALSKSCGAENNFFLCNTEKSLVSCSLTTTTPMFGLCVIFCLLINYSSSQQLVWKCAEPESGSTWAWAREENSARRSICLSRSTGSVKLKEKLSFSLHSLRCCCCSPLVNILKNWKNTFPFHFPPTRYSRFIGFFFVCCFSYNVGDSRLYVNSMRRCTRCEMCFSTACSCTRIAMKRWNVCDARCFWGKSEWVGSDGFVCYTFHWENIINDC